MKKIILSAILIMSILFSWINVFAEETCEYKEVSKKYWNIYKLVYSQKWNEFAFVVKKDWKYFVVKDWVESNEYDYIDSLK